MRILLVNPSYPLEEFPRLLVTLPYLVALRAQSRREVGKGHEQAWELLERVRRIDQQNAHEAPRNAESRRYGDAVHPRPAFDVTRPASGSRFRNPNLANEPRNGPARAGAKRAR